MIGGFRHPRRAVAAIFAFVLVALFAGCGGADSTTVADTAGEEAEARQESPAPPQRTTGPPRAVLHPVDGSDASGVVRFEKTPQGIPLMTIRVRGLPPVHGQERYVLWQWGSRHDMLGMSSFSSKADERVNRRQEGVYEMFTFFEDGSKAEILIARVKSYDRYVKGLSDADPWDPEEVGKPILRGPITGSLVGAKEAG